MKLITLISMLVLLLFIISFWLKLSTTMNEKKSNFECGFDPNHESRNSFSMRFFLITIIFLLFDLEITFILSLPLHMKSNPTMSTSSVHMMIMIIFTWSMYMEWQQGALKWFWLDI